MKCKFIHKFFALFITVVILISYFFNTYQSIRYFSLESTDAGYTQVYHSKYSAALEGLNFISDNEEESNLLQFAQIFIIIASFVFIAYYTFVNKVYFSLQLIRLSKRPLFLMIRQFRN